MIGQTIFWPGNNRPKRISDTVLSGRCTLFVSNTHI